MFTTSSTWVLYKRYTDVPTADTPRVAFFRGRFVFFYAPCLPLRIVCYQGGVDPTPDVVERGVRTATSPLALGSDRYISIQAATVGFTIVYPVVST